jgi:hypothetical protein
MGASYEEVISCDFSTAFGEESWVFLSVLFVNWLNGSRGVPRGRWRKTDLNAVTCLRAAVQRALRLDKVVERSLAAVEKELASRFVSYTGEEVPKMEPLSCEQIIPGLPPKVMGDPYQ